MNLHDKKEDMRNPAFKNVECSSEVHLYSVAYICWSNDMSKNSLKFCKNKKKDKTFFPTLNIDLNAINFNFFFSFESIWTWLG